MSLSSEQNGVDNNVVDAAVDLNNASGSMLQNARKILPHKKRIARKLKVDQSGEIVKPADGLEPEKKISTMQQFNCGLCDHSTSSQLQFFIHLKFHYEPFLRPLFAALKESLTEMDDFPKPYKEEHYLQAEAYLNLEDFPNVAETHTNLVENMRNTVTNVVSTAEASTLNSITVDEFSENEDMLEGIRNVVDKVSIEDTCDAMELISSTEIRPVIGDSIMGDLSFAGSISQIPAPSILSPACKENNNIIDGILNTPQPIIEDIRTTAIANSPEERLLIIDDAVGDMSSVEGADDQIDTDSEIIPLITENISTSLKRRHCRRKNHVCTKCSREFNSGNALKYHYRTHDGVRPYKCKICEMSFFAQSALTSHENIHSGHRPFKCEHCQRGFRQWGDLKYHIVSLHTNNKSHQCEFCGKAFSRKYSLVVHRRIHTSERNYKCEFCGKTFRASGYLQNHRKIHTGENPYECNVCTKKFRVSGDLRRHMRIHQRVLESKQPAIVAVEGESARDAQKCTNR